MPLKSVDNPRPRRAAIESIEAAEGLKRVLGRHHADAPAGRARKPQRVLGAGENAPRPRRCRLIRKLAAVRVFAANADEQVAC